MTRTITVADVVGMELQLAAELPGFRIGYKNESKLQRFLGALVRPFNPTYLTEYTTVLGGVVWVPSREWRARQSPASLYGLLRHEAVHLRDMRRFSILFPLSYVLVLPSVLTLRSVWEARAYRETLRVEFELTGAIADTTLDQLAERFVGRDYLFMAPFPKLVRRYWERVRREIKAESETP